MASYHKKTTTKGDVWICRFRIVEDGKEVQKTLSPFPIKKKAQEAYRAFMATYTPQEKRESGDLTFAQLFELYKNYNKSRLKPTSYYDTCQKVKNWILPTFADMKIEKIKPVHLIEWQAKLDGYSHAYKKSIREQFSSIFNFAVRYYNLPFNPFTKVEPLRSLEQKKEMSYWSFEEFSKFIETITSPEYKMLFEFLYFTGCRKGEALALSWDDIDIIKGICKISKSVSRKGTRDLTENGYLITTPKNKSSNRAISLGTLTEKLKEYKKWQLEKYKTVNFIFGDEHPLPDSNIRRALLAGIDASGVKKIRVHDLRHSHCSLLISSGVSIVAVAKRLGHSDTQQTLNTYAHMLPSDDEHILNIINEKLY